MTPRPWTAPSTTSATSGMRSSSSTCWTGPSSSSRSARRPSFVDMETGERLQVDPAYVRDDYRRQLDGVPRPLSTDLRRLPVRLCADRYVGSFRPHALAVPGETDPAMTFAAPLFLLAATGRADPGGAAPDPPAEGQGGAVQHAPVPPGQRPADPAAEVCRGHVAPGRAGGRAAA